MGGSPPKWDRENLKFLTTGAGYMKFSGVGPHKETKFEDTKMEAPLKHCHKIFELLNH